MTGRKRRPDISLILSVLGWALPEEETSQASLQEPFMVRIRKMLKQWLDLRCGHVGYVGGGEWGGVFVYGVCGVVWCMQCVHVHMA